MALYTVNSKGYTGEKDGYLYWKGKRLEADDDYKVYTFGGKYYLVNTKGKLQKSTSKKYDVETKDGRSVADVQFSDIYKKSYEISGEAFSKEGDSKVAFDYKANACIPHIALKDDWIVSDGSKDNYEIWVGGSDVDFITTDMIGTTTTAEDGSDEEDL